MLMADGEELQQQVEGIRTATGWCGSCRWRRWRGRRREGRLLEGIPSRKIPDTEGGHREAGTEWTSLIFCAVATQPLRSAGTGDSTGPFFVDAGRRMAYRRSKQGG